MTGAVAAPDAIIKLAGFGFRHVGSAEPALRDITLAVRPGEYLGVLGATGSGVSTLLAAINGIVPQLVRGETSGAIEVLGLDPRVVPVREWARRVGLVLDDPSLAATQATVADEVAFGLENLGVPAGEMDARIASALFAVGLSGLGPRAPQTLSGGEQQRLAIACALVTGPSILVLDEPSANLDPAGRRVVFGVLRRLNREHGVTVIMADGDVEAIAADATRVVVLDRGAMVGDGAPADVLGDPAALAGHGLRSTGAAGLAAALGMPVPVPVDVDALARRLARRPPPASVLEAPRGPVLVDLRHVGFRYPGAASRAVTGVSMQVSAGEVVGVVGANGSGKTTLGRLVNGLLRPLEGEVDVDGLRTASHPVRTLAAHVGSVFQDPAHQLFASTVADELALGPRALGRSEAAIGERVRALAAELGLDEVLGRHPLRLGRAERKLVALAAVLAMDPRVLVLDEPTTGADAQLASIIEAQVLAARERGCAVLVASHDMAFLGRVASRLVVMDGGRLLAEGPARRVFADAPLLAVAGLDAPAVTRVALAVGGRGGDGWPPVTLEESVGWLEAVVPPGDGVTGHGSTGQRQRARNGVGADAAGDGPGRPR